MALTPEERETVITLNDAEDVAEVYTHQRTVITKLKKNPAAILVDEGRFESTAWARFLLPKTLISFRTGKTSRKTFSTQNLDRYRGSERTEAS